MYTNMICDYYLDLINIYYRGKFYLLCLVYAFSEIGRNKLVFYYVRVCYLTNITYFLGCKFNVLCWILFYLNNIVFLGASSMCLVEYAPCQKLDGIGRKLKKADAKSGTIYEGMIYFVNFFRCLYMISFSIRFWASH